MAPQIFNYDPNAGLTAIQKAGENISGILAEAGKAEQEMTLRKKRTEAIQFLQETISTRTRENPNVGYFPLHDPVVRDAAMAVSPIAKDYVELLVGLHEKNVKAAEPKCVSGGYLEPNLADGTYKFVDTTPTAGAEKNPTNASLALAAAGGDKTAMRALGLLDKTSGERNPTNASLALEASGGDARKALELLDKPSKDKEAEAKDKILKQIDAKKDEAYKVGQEMANFDFNTLADPNVVDLAEGKFLQPQAEKMYNERKNAYVNRLASLRKELVALNKQVGGTFGADVPENAGADGDTEFTVKEARAEHPDLKDLSDQEIIDGYKKQGVVVKP